MAGPPVDAAAVPPWFDWYADSAARTVLWQIGLLREPRISRCRCTCRSPGEGSCPPTSPPRPQRRWTARPTPTGAWSGACTTPTSCGPIAAAAGTGNVSSTSPGSTTRTAVAARELDPPQDSCQARTTLAAAAGAHRSSTPGRRRAGPSPTPVQPACAVVGENPGPPATPGNRRRRVVRRSRRPAPPRPRLRAGMRARGPDVGLRGRPVQPGLRGDARRSTPDASLD